MARFRKTNLTQHMLVAVELQEQLMRGTMEKTINDLIDRMDMKVFMDRYKNDETGAPAYDPRILLKIILFAYSRGILSSRKIAQAAEKNITFIALSGYSKPDFTTIAHFVSSMEREIMFVFTYVLKVCQRLDLIGGERFALDGHQSAGSLLANSKMSSNASKEMSGTFPKFEKKVSKLKAILADLMQQHKTADTEEAKHSLSQRIKKKEHMIEKIETFVAENEPKKPTRKANVYANQKKEKLRGYGATDFTYNDALDQFTCKNGKLLTRWGSSMRGDARYGIAKGECAACSLLTTCMPRAKQGSRKTLTVKTEATTNRNMPFTALMRAKIDSPEGRLIYSQRMKIIEPVFSNITVQKGMHKFTLRGKTKVGIQNLLYYIVHNIGKIALAVRSQNAAIAV